MPFRIIVIFLMTRPAVRWRTLVHSADVALLATRLHMCPRQWKIRCAVIECTLIPIIRVMTQRAIVREVIRHMPFRVIVILLMTRPAVRRRTLVDSSDMTLLAIRLHMRARQRKLRECMAKCTQPVRSRVAQFACLRIAVRDVFLRAVVILLMTRPAICRRARVLSVGVTLSAIRLHMRACQRKVGHGVIKRRLTPFRSRMTNRAILRILSSYVIWVGG